MSDMEQCYSQIEKEALSLVWACEKFSDYIIGRPVHLETDHKPLIPLLTRTYLDRLPPRIVRFRLRLMQFNYTISHVPGKLLYTADTLSRAPVDPADKTVIADAETEMFVQAVISHLPVSTSRLEDFCKAQKEDPTCSQLMKFCRGGWPNRNSHELSGELCRYFTVKDHLSIVDNLLLYGNRIVVPHSMRDEILGKLHTGHQGIQRCRLRLATSVWWPGVSKEIEQFIKSCPECQKKTAPHTEPLLQPALWRHPWEKLAMDLFQLKGKSYLLVVDYFSKYIEIQALSSTTSENVVTALKAIFSCHGIPTTLISDNGPQYITEDMKVFAKEYGFQQVTSSLYYPKSNGQAERTVRIIKHLLKCSPDLYLTLLSYRATPLPFCGLSPGELFMGQKIHTDLPQPQKNLLPNWPHLQDFKKKHQMFKAYQKKHYDRRHRVRSLPILPEDQPVWVNMEGRQIPGTVLRQADTPRSYLVETPSGQVRRNCSHVEDLKVLIIQLKLNQYRYPVQSTPVHVLEQPFDLQTDLTCSSEEEVYHVTDLSYTHAHVTIIRDYSGQFYSVCYCSCTLLILL